MNDLLFLFFSAAILIALYAWLLPQAIRQRREYFESLPTLNEAQKHIEQHHPEHINDFQLVRKPTEYVYPTWGPPVAIEFGDFLECKAINVSIRIRTET